MVHTSTYINILAKLRTLNPGFVAIAAADRPGESQLFRAAVREPEGDTPALAVPRRAAAAGAGCGWEGPPRQPAAAGCAAPLQLQEEGVVF